MQYAGGAQAARLLAGKYRVERLLGRGGLGFVVAATDVRTGQRCAIKFLLAKTAMNDMAIERFRREAIAVASIDNDHVVRVYEVGQTESGAPFMVMEYLEGQDLGALVEASGPLPVGDAVVYFLQACSALKQAHAAGIVHRDLKPGNLFLTRAASGVPCLKVLDFGISKVRAFDRVISDANLVMGSPGYMSPEQMRATRDTDARSDIWALGASLYEVLTGRRPFHGATLSELLIAIHKASPASPSLLRPEVPEGLATVVLTCLAKLPEDRYPDVDALAAALRPYAPLREAISASGSAQAPSATPGATEARVSEPMLATSSAARPTRRWWLAVPIALALGVLAALLLPAASTPPAGAASSSGVTPPAE